jgi:ankyrin repeat protein
VFLIPAPARAVDPAMLLTDSRYWEAATPEQARALIAGRSLAGMRTAKRYESDKEILTPLMVAAWSTPYPEVIHILVRAGCKATDLKSEPLMKALYNPNPAVLEAVLRYKPDLNAEDTFLGTALHRLAAETPAAFALRKEHFRLLLEAGADIDRQSKNDKETPLMEAASHRNTEAGRMLLDAGARTDITNRRGSALDIAVDSEAHELARLLLKAGGIAEKRNRHP